MAPVSDKPPAILSGVGIAQNLNQQLPLGLTFTDDAGKQVELASYFGKRPAILALVYYQCPMLCSEELNGLTGALQMVKFVPGKDFDVIVVSIDPTEGTDLAAAKKRLDGGTLLKAGMLDIEVRLAQAREELVRARNANALAVRVLRNLLGIEKGDFEVADAGPATHAPDSGDFSGRPELAAARQRERAAQEQVSAAKGSYLPRVNAFGSMDYDYGWKYQVGGGSYTAGALLQWDLWDGRLTRAKVQEANANLESAREEQRKLRLALDLEVEKARLELNAANERLNVTDQMVAQAAESASLTRARFEQELALSTELIDAETAVLAARVRRAEAEADRQIAIAAVRKALALPQLDSQAK